MGHCIASSLGERFAASVIDRVPRLAARAAYAKRAICDKLIEHKE
ncbi:MAG TPA: hypothetical protein VJY34_12375 [Roseiarcus sp.]|nr:hypothetical protein [Roseiarcus sp.]